MVVPPAHAIEFVPPQTDETADPRDRPRGGGSRPICNRPNRLPCVPKSMLALVPRSLPFGLTVSATPKLWFFSPYNSDEPITASFELIDAQEQVVWQDSTLTLRSQPGVFAYQIPPDANLKVGQTYRWYLIVHLDPDQPSSDVVLSARLNYQNSALISADEGSLERLQELASQGIWYDMVTGLAQLGQSQRSRWDNFLADHGFQELMGYPLYSVED